MIPSFGNGADLDHGENVNATATCPQTGSVTAVRGGIVDVRFSSQLPSIQSLLLTGKSGEVLIEVLSQLDGHNVRGIALTPTQGLVRGNAGNGHGGSIACAGGQGNAFPHVRRIGT